MNCAWFADIKSDLFDAMYVSCSLTCATIASEDNAVVSSEARLRVNKTPRSLSRPTTEGSCFYDIPSPFPKASDMTLHYADWERYLVDDFNSEFILEGVRNGFKIVESDLEFDSTFCKNYRSATLVSKAQSEKQILVEIDKGRYVITNKPPRVVSAIGAIPKINDKVRLIHDLSRPQGGINGYFGRIFYDFRCYQNDKAWIFYRKN